MDLFITHSSPAGGNLPMTSNCEEGLSRGLDMSLVMALRDFLRPANPAVL